MTSTVISKRRSRTPVRGVGGQVLKYDQPLLVYMQFRIPDYQKKWLEDHRTPERSMADIIRELIDKEMKR